MSSYRYIFADLLTNSVLAELDLESATFGRVLNKAGLFQAYIGLGMTGLSDSDIINATIPGRTAIYVERTGTGDKAGSLIWGGILWSRVWSEEQKKFQLNGQTFESFAYQEDIRTTLSYVNMDQRNILCDLFNKMQAYKYRNIGIIVPSSFPNNILRSTSFFDYEVNTFGLAIEYMIGYAQGFDYTIEVNYDTNGNPAKILRVDDVLGTPVSTSQVVFDYPGNLDDFIVPENAINGCTTISAIGAGEGSAMVRGLQTNQKLLDGGYPELVDIFTDKSVSDPSTLASKAVQQLVVQQVPLSVPTYTTFPDKEPKFGTYKLGDYAQFKLQSQRFAQLPNSTLETTARIVGWDITPTQESSPEQVKLIVSGQDATG